MHKSIDLKLKLHVEGDDEPANDFEARAGQAVRDLLAGGRRPESALKVTVKEIAEDTDDADDETAASATT